VARNKSLAVSQDGSHLAVVTTNSDTFYGGSLRLVDFAGQRVYSTSVKVDSWVSGMVFSPDGTC
jgi:WD40 repeat protein